MLKISDCFLCIFMRFNFIHVENKTLQNIETAEKDLSQISLLLFLLIKFYYIEF